MIPILREQMFEFQEYIGFVKCMNAMKGMKLCYKDRDSEKAWTSNIRVSWNALSSVGTTLLVVAWQEVSQVLVSHKLASNQLLVPAQDKFKAMLRV